MTTQHGLGKLVNQVKPFSKLFIGSRYARKTHKIVQPELRLDDHLNSEYLDKVKRSLHLRGANRNGLIEVDFELLKENVQELLSRQVKFQSLKAEGEMERASIERNHIFELEEQVVPIILRLPNLFNEDKVPTKGYEDRVIKESTLRGYDFKLLDAKRISYINDLRKSSILGPHCEYLLGRGAQITRAAQKYFRKSIQAQFPEKIGKKMKHRHLHEVDGLDILKSALIEAASDYDELNCETDSLRIDFKDDDDDRQQTHLVGNCSKGGLLSLLIKKQIDSKCLPARFIQFGSSYEQNLRQVNLIFFFSIVENDFQKSNEEFEFIQQMITDLYIPFNLPIRVRRTNVKRLNFNEYDRVEFDVFFPYAREWRRIGHLSHYSDYLPLRVHCTKNHCLGGNLTDLGMLLDAILENHQTETGKIEIPECLTNYM